MNTQQIAKQKLPLWFWAATGLGLVWNVFGLFQFVNSLSATPESLMAQGLSAEQASVMLGYPGWMTAAFAIGVIGGVVGCIGLALRKSWAQPVFLISLSAYIALWIGDFIHGVFAALGTPQVIILTIVVAIALALLLLTLRFKARL